MRPVHILSVIGLTFFLLAISPLLRGQEQTPMRPAAKPKEAEVPKVSLPVTRVVMYNAGVAHIIREGAVDGTGRFELRFPEADLNDLIKSLTIADRDGGKIGAVTYENRIPADFTLKSFAVDVTENPTLGQLLHQVRGEKIEVVDKAGAVLVGQIVSVERPIVQAGGTDPGEQLNLLTEDGIQSVALRDTKKTRFVRPELQAEFRKALEMLAAARGDNKKAVAVVLSGNGKRRIAVAYVAEAPMWKPTYRLSIDDTKKAQLQGWAAIENTTDEDWVNVKMGLAAGRPISFQMDLYDPLFVPRPTVEPELFSSLRPTVYQGGMNSQVDGVGMGNQGALAPRGNNQGFNQGGGMGMGGMGMMGIQSGGMGMQGYIGGFGGQGFSGQGGFGNLGGQFGLQGGQNGNLGAQFGFQGGGYLPRAARPDVRELFGQRVNYQEYLRRLKNPNVKANQPGEVAAPAKIRDPLDPNEGVLAAGGGKSLGDTFSYTIAEPVSLPRQKSALLAIVNEPVEGSRISIYNAASLVKHPLLGLKFINKTKLSLAQGPVTVYDGDAYAGDARLPDLKPGETRFISYAIDLGTEIVVKEGDHTSTQQVTKVADGLLHTVSHNQRTTTYSVRNRDVKDRTVILEHPIDQRWVLADTEKPVDRSRNFYRFEVVVKAGELKKVDVKEEHKLNAEWALVSSTTDNIRLKFFLEQPKTSPAIKQILTQVLALRAKQDEIAKGLDAEQTALKEIGEDQARLRANIDRVPKDSDAHKRYLKKFDDQETEIERRQSRIKELKAEVQKQTKVLKDFVDSAKAE
jgi:hypothetical protein